MIDISASDWIVTITLQYNILDLKSFSDQITWLFTPRAIPKPGSPPPPPPPHPTPTPQPPDSVHGVSTMVYYVKVLLSVKTINANLNIV